MRIERTADNFMGLRVFEEWWFVLNERELGTLRRAANILEDGRDRVRGFVGYDDSDEEYALAVVESRIRELLGAPLIRLPKPEVKPEGA